MDFINQTKLGCFFKLTQHFLETFLFWFSFTYCNGHFT